MGLLLIERLGVGLRQAQQVPACEEDQQPTKDQAEQQKAADQRRGYHLGLVATRSTLDSLRLDQLIELPAHLLDQLATTIGADVLHHRQSFTTPFDRELGKFHPLVFQRLDPLDSPALGRIVTNLLLELGQPALEDRQATVIGRQENFLTGDEIAAHAAFEV